MNRLDVALATVVLVALIAVPPLVVAVLVPLSWAGRVLEAAANGLARPEALVRLLGGAGTVAAWTAFVATVLAEWSAMVRGIVRAPRSNRRGRIGTLVERSVLGGPVALGSGRVAPLRTRLRLAVDPACAGPTNRRDDAQPEMRREPASSVVAAPLSEPHVAQRGETWWSLADERLGDGQRWAELVELNRGTEVDGIVIGPGVRLRRGWRILLPAPVQPPSDSPSVSRAANVRRL